MIHTRLPQGQRLLLEELKINLEGDKPALHGAAASIGNDGFNTHYRHIQVPIEYSGGLLIASGFLEELNSNRGFHSAWKYDEVHELRFEQGRLTATTNVSELMCGFRKDMRGRALTAGGGDAEGEGRVG